MSNKYRNLIAALIIIGGFIIRVYAATTVPLGWDEEDFFQAARKISFNLKNPNLPLVDPDYPNPIFIKYVVKLGLSLFGDNDFGGRMPFVILGAITSLLVYMLVHRALGYRKAILSLLLLTFSQFFIGNTRVASDVCVITFAGILNFYLFYNTLRSQSSKMIILCGLLIGLTFFVKENLSFFLAIFFIFLLLTPKYRFWLKRKEPYIAVFIAFCFMFWLTLLNYTKATPRLGYIRGESAFGLSINAIGMFLGELIIMLFRNSPNIDLLLDSTDYELPFMFWPMGILCLIGVFYSLKDRKNDFIRLMLTGFFFNFILFTFIRNIGDTPGPRFYLSLGSPDWGVLLFLPAVILTANMLGDLILRHKAYLVITAFLMILFAGNAWRFINFPLNCFIPIKGYAVAQYFGLAENYYRAKDKRAKDLFERIYRVAEDGSFYKMESARRLAEIPTAEKR